MGQAALRASRAVLREEVQLHFKSGQVKADVEEVIRGWFDDGAPLGLSLSMFKRTFDFQDEHAARYFAVFDTDNNKKADAFEALAVLVILADGPWEAKVDAMFPIFDFSSTGRLNFDEMNILVQSACRGLEKVCKTPPVEGTTLVEVCQQMFDSHNLRYDETISKEQFRRWLRAGSKDASRFLDIYQHAYSLPDVEAEIAGHEQNQAAIFSQLTSSTSVPAEVLMSCESLRGLLGVSDEVYAALVKRMSAPGVGNVETVTLERFVEVMHAWNAYNAADTTKEGALDPKEIRPLLWFQTRNEPDEKTIERMRERLFAESRIEALEKSKATISRDAWITANAS